MVFNIEDYEGRYVMHCATIFEAISFTNYLHNIKRRWSNGQKYVNNHTWESYKEETAYNFNLNTYGAASDYQRDGYTILEWKDFMYDMPSLLIDNINLYDRNIITIAGIDFIKFPEENGAIPIVSRERVLYQSFDSNTNNFATSYLYRNLCSDILPLIEDAIGKENVLEFETDLTSVHGYKRHGTMKSKIAIPTLGFYSKHIEIFDRYVDDVGGYWWLATPWIAKNKGDRQCILIDGSGKISWDSSIYDYAARPILYIKADALTVQN